MKLEWMEMMKSGTPSYSNFDIAAYLTEIILLGCIAMRVGEGTRMEWDGPNMKSPNIPDAAKFVNARTARVGSSKARSSKTRLRRSRPKPDSKNANDRNDDIVSVVPLYSLVRIRGRCASQKAGSVIRTVFPLALSLEDPPKLVRRILRLLRLVRRLIRLLLLLLRLLLLLLLLLCCCCCCCCCCC